MHDTIHSLPVGRYLIPYGVYGRMESDHTWVTNHGMRRRETKRIVTIADGMERRRSRLIRGRVWPRLAVPDAAASRRHKTMTIPLHAAIDEARYIRSVGHTGGLTEIYTWKGGHTVNVYTTHNGMDGMQVHAARCFSVGSFEENAASREEVKDAVQREITESKQEI